MIIQFVCDNSYQKNDDNAGLQSVHKEEPMHGTKNLALCIHSIALFRQPYANFLYGCVFRAP